MKTCKGCGSFYNKKCEYCGYENTAWVESDRVEFSTLKIVGKMNRVKIEYGEPSRESEIVVNGKMARLTIKAKVININIEGKMNTVTIDKNVKYASVINGKMNTIG